GCGFTKQRFEKFNTLLEDEDKNHKGLGRLVYLKYFKNIEVESVFNSNQIRIFTFDIDGTIETKSVQEIPSEISNYTNIKFTGYLLDRIYNKEYVDADSIKKSLYERFLPRLYKLKNENKEISINIQCNLNPIVTLNNKELPILKKIDCKLEIGNKNELFPSTIQYAINDQPDSKTKDFITGLCIDDRIYKGLGNIIEDKNLPNGTFIFLLDSNTIQVNADRETINENTINLKKIKNIFRNEIVNLLKNELPNLQNTIQTEIDSIEDKYPHLNSYFEKNQIGFVESKTLIQDAQEQFSKDQMDVIEKQDNMTETTYQKSFDLSARTLANYILFRKFNIEKFKKLSEQKFKKKSEAIHEIKIHDLILPKGEHSNPKNNIYQNNVWILDDKFMSFEFALSDQKLSNLKKHLYPNDSDINGNNEPDICLVFNKDPENPETTKFNVVIIELKRKGLDVVDAVSRIEDQLLTSAINLANYYSNKIDNIWYYGCLDINDKIKQDLKNKYSGRWKKIFSHGDVYVQSTSILNNSISLDMFLLSYQTIGQDAEDRNKTFLNILKNSFKNEPENNAD
ncbi:MAG: hypothetical protein ORN58_06765, partial [Sediminibacterium sp.]|nr:hypothetical protein [Sediminibacterium sp.]